MEAGDVWLIVILLFLVVVIAVLGALLWRQRRAVRRLERIVSSDTLRSSDPVIGLARGIRRMRQEFSTLVEDCGDVKRSVGALLDGSDDGFVVLNEHLQIELVNRRVRKLFDVKEPPEGKRLIEALLSDRLVEIAEEARDSGNRVRGTITLNTSRAQKRGGSGDAFLDVEAAPMDEAGSGRIALILHDVTDSRTRARAAREFVANASHELRTPMSIISGYLENILDGEIDDEENLMRSLGVMQKHSSRITRIVDEMLMISRLDGQHQPLALETFDLRECAALVVDQLGALIVAGNARVRLDFPKNREERLVAGDRFYWDQILFNLIENVLKHNRARGVRATVRLDRSDGRQRLVVEDDGIGIASKDLPFVFDRFYRADSPRAGVAKGTGLGLSIVRRAVEAHGGEIAVESAPGVRTRFTILFQI